MRKELRKQNNQRKRFSGRFERMGSKDSFGYTKITVLLKDIRDSSGVVVADHLWFNQTKGFVGLGLLEVGDKISFDARVRPYVKGYVNHREYIDEREWDYKLSHPTKFRIEQRTQKLVSEKDGGETDE